MAGLFARRILQAVPAIVGVTLVVFLLLHSSGDPSHFMLPPEATDADRQAFRRSYGLDKPLPVQYGVFLLRVARGDLGQSLAYKQSAFKVLVSRIGPTLELALLSTALAVVVGIPAGLLAAFRQNSMLDSLVMLGATFGQSVAGFWLGLMLIIVVSVKLDLLPASGHGGLAHLVLPVVTLSTWLTALLARLTRSSLLEVLRLDYVRTAYAKGLETKIVLARHALRNSLIPIVTVLGISLSYQMGGTVVVEAIFARRGIGTLVLDSVLRRDYPVVLAAVLFVALVFVMVNFLVDVLYGILDPRVRLKGIGERG